MPANANDSAISKTVKIKILTKLFWASKHKAYGHPPNMNFVQDSQVTCFGPLGMIWPFSLSCYCKNKRKSNFRAWRLGWHPFCVKIVRNRAKCLENLIFDHEDWPLDFKLVSLLLKQHNQENNNRKVRSRKLASIWERTVRERKKLKCKDERNFTAH